MIAIALLVGAALLVSGGLALILLREAWVAALWYRLFNDPEPEPYHPLFAEAPDLVQRAYQDAGDTFGFQRSVPYIASDHPLDCAQACCWEIRLDELHDAYDWHAAEHEMRSKR